MQAPVNPLPSSAASLPPEEPTAWQGPLFQNVPRTLACVLVLAGAGLGLSYVMAPEYMAHAKIILPNSSNRSSALAGLAGLAGVGSEGSSLPMFAAILNSERMLDRLSKHSGIPRKKLRKAFQVRDDVKSNTIEISATGQDRAKMLNLVRDSLGGLTEITAKVNLPVREDQTSRLAATLTNRQQSLAEAEGTLKAFLQTSKTLPGGSVDVAIATPTTATDPNSASGESAIGSIQNGLGYKQQLSSLEIQLKKLDSSVARIRANSDAQKSEAPLDLPPVKLWSEPITKAEAKLAELRPHYQPDSPEIREAEKALALLLERRRQDVNRYLASVKASLAGSSQSLAVTRAGIVTQIEELKKYVDVAPNETIEYLRLFQNVASNQAIVNQVRLLYEKARLDQGNDPNTWTVLDMPEIDPDYDSRKSSQKIMMGGIAGLGLAYWLGSRRTAQKRA